jgi:DNA-binding transcriptional regulator LsrR (DeoR family)
MVGDLLYSGFDSEGEPVPFSVNGQDVHFFSALSLGTLEELVKASRPDREVLLIARRTDRGFEKHIAIHSALQKHSYASRLILDDVTARALFNRIDAFAN